MRHFHEAGLALVAPGARGAFRRALCLALCLAAGLTLLPPQARAEAPTITIISPNGPADGTSADGGPAEDRAGTGSSLDLNAEDGAADGEGAAQPAPQGDAAARADFIDRIISLAKDKFDQAGGRAQRAHYSGDIYVCKNFTVYLFRQNCEDFRMAEYPDAPLVIPDNQKKEDCKPYVYGVEWKDIPASQGNPFYAAATFRYDEKLSKAENRQKAREFLMQVQRGDYFQMAAKYYYGTGAHSMIYIADYDSATDSVHWTDSNMKGKKVGDERYGYVQYDAVKEIDWFVDAFCRKGYGATLYRLREDIVYAK